MFKYLIVILHTQNSNLQKLSHFIPKPQILAQKSLPRPFYCMLFFEEETPRPFISGNYKGDGLGRWLV